MTANQIQANAAVNYQLLSDIVAVEYAPSALQQQQVYVNDLNRTIAETDKDLRSLRTKVDAELKDHKKYRDSTMRRFAHRVARKEDKFNERAAKEEKEYFEAVQQENQAKSRRETLGQPLEQAKSVQADYQRDATRCADLQAQLDAMYNSISSGPTPEFPEEDAKEWPVQHAKSAYDEVARRFDIESQTTHLLRDAKACMVKAVRHMSEAHNWSTMDMFGGGTYTDISERNALSQAEVMVSQIDMMVSQARRMNSNVQNIGPMKVAQGSIVGDIIFDNIFSDMEMHAKIKESEQQMQQGAVKLERELGNAEQRLADLKNQMNEAGTRLELARKELQKVRQDTFDKVMYGQGQAQTQSQGQAWNQDQWQQAPPPYDGGYNQQQQYY